MKVGDKIRRKDMPSIIYHILGESDEWKTMWSVELVLPSKKGILIQQGMINKDDDRWEVIKPR